MKSENNSLRLSELGRQILGYLEKHPDAGDTVDGIVQWWLMEQRIERQVAETAHELEALAAIRLVQKFSRQQGKTHYRVNPTKLAEIRTILTGAQTAD